MNKSIVALVSTLLTASALAQEPKNPVNTYVSQLGAFTAMLNLCGAKPIEKQQFQIWLSHQETPLNLVYNLEPAQFRTWLQDGARSVPAKPTNCSAFLSQWPAFSQALYLNKAQAASTMIDSPTKE